MDHRHTIYPSQMSEIDYAHRIWNHRNHDPRLHLGNGPSMRPTDGITVGGVNSSGHLTPAPRPRDYSSSRFTPEASNHRAAYSGALQDPHPHPSAYSSSSHSQLNRAQQDSYYYDRHTTVDGSSTVSPPTDDRRVASKRKSPYVPQVFDRVDVSAYHCAGTSPNLHIASDRPTPIPNPRLLPTNLTTTVPSYWSDNHVTTGEGFERNVRSRHGHPLHLETNPAVVYSSSNLPRYFNSTANVSGRNVAGQWSHFPESSTPRGIPSSDYGSFNYGMNQSLPGSTIGNGIVGIDAAYSNPGPMQRRYPVAMTPTAHGASTVDTGMGRSTFDQRPTPYRATPSHHPFAGSATAPFEDAWPPGVEAIASSSHPMQLPTIGRSRERNRRAMNLHGRLPPSYADDAGSVWVSEALVIVDPSIFYESGDFDEYGDMRLDIDNMSYEELLALEERIGNASTGLREDLISRCLIATVFRSSDQNQGHGEEGKCVVCQEEYKELDDLGRLNCGHGFHTSCIKGWLQIKNACPICKAPALPDASK